MRGLIEFNRFSLICGIFTSIDNEVGLLHFISFIAKIVVDCAEALYVRITGRSYLFLHLFLTRC